MRWIAAAGGVLVLAAVAHAGGQQPESSAAALQTQPPASQQPSVPADIPSAPPETQAPIEGQRAPETAPASPTERAGASTTASAARVFASESGMIFSAIRADKVTDFEFVLGRLKQALATSTDPVRQKQAAGWRIFKAAEPGPNSSVLYVFVMDPAVKGADYGVARILAESFPDEVLDLYKLYNGAFAAGQTLLNLAPAPAAVPPGTKPTPPSGAKPAPQEAKP